MQEQTRGILCRLLLVLSLLMQGCAQEQSGASYDLTQCPEVIELTANPFNFYPILGLTQPFPVFVCDPPAFRYQHCVYAEFTPEGDTCQRAYTYLKKLPA
jgi:hypothetical protein